MIHYECEKLDDMKSSVALIAGVILIVLGAMTYLFVRQSFTDCPSFVGLAVGVMPKNIFG